MNRARTMFLVACAASIVAVVFYVMVTPSRVGTRPADAAAAEHVTAIASVPAAPFVLFRDLSPGAQYGRIAVAPLPVVAGAARLVAPLSCERVHYAAGWGVCMVTDETHLPVRYVAYVFDRFFQRQKEIPLTGPPIRARVSPDGRRAALTVFETGHSYADQAFSTRTIVIDTATGRRLADLEDFAVQKDGAPLKSADFNFWGVTFARDGDHFFATLKTHGERYLLKGSIDTRQAVVVRGDVECPSLSPDGTLVAFKKPIARTLGWRLYVLDLATGAEHPLNQVRPSVDDQVDWFDAAHVVYHDSAPEGTGVWVLSVDGVTPPRLLLPNAYSPAVQR